MAKHKSSAKKVSALGVVAIIVVACLIGLVIGAIAYAAATRPTGGDELPSDGLNIHFLQLGNDYTGDCIYIKAGDADILVDGGSRENSADDICAFINEYVTDNTLEYVIVTHADQDHIAAFAGNGSNQSLFLSYECETIIDFARTNKTTAVYGRYCAQRDAEVESGAKHYTALQCWNNEDGAQRTYALGSNITLTILYQKFYEEYASDENNYSVSFLLTQGSKRFLFTGDLESEGEQSLIANNELPQVDLFKAGHHGSYTASTAALLNVIKPKIACVTCVAGSTEYTTNVSNTFPSQSFIERIAPYTDSVYVTSMESNGHAVAFNGNINVSSDGKNVTVDCSANNTKLKDSSWFGANRTLPDAWK